MPSWGSVSIGLKFEISGAKSFYFKEVHKLEKERLVLAIDRKICKEESNA
jgi:hypothetical protein